MVLSEVLVVLVVLPEWILLLLILFGTSTMRQYLVYSMYCQLECYPPTCRILLPDPLTELSSGLRRGTPDSRHNQNFLVSRWWSEPGKWLQTSGMMMDTACLVKWVNNFTQQLPYNPPNRRNNVTIILSYSLSISGWPLHRLSHRFTIRMSPQTKAGGTFIVASARAMAAVHCFALRHADNLGPFYGWNSLVGKNGSNIFLPNGSKLMI